MKERSEQSKRENTSGPDAAASEKYWIVTLLPAPKMTFANGKELIGPQHE
jgi:hypothetical protein